MTGINQRGRYGRYIHLLLMIADVVILNCALALTTIISPEFVAVRARTVWLLCTLTYLPVSYWLSIAHTRRTIQMDHVFRNSLRAVGAHALLFIFSLYFVGIDQIPWYSFVEFYGICFVIFPLWWIISRLILKNYRRKGRNFCRAVIIGTNSTAQRLYHEMLSDAGFGYRFMGFFSDDGVGGVPAHLYRGELSDVADFVEKEKVDEIYFTLSGETESNAIQKMISIADANVIQFYYVPQLNRFVTRNYEMSAMGRMPVLPVRHNPLMNAGSRLTKRAFDIVFSSVALICSPIIFIPVAIAIKMSSPGPVFFRQKRTGYRGREFYCYKFRTMRVNVDADRVQATEDDPRKTRVGDFLRRTSIDELPQFFNVWIGNMSIVGPRPHMLAHTEEYRSLIDKYMVRHLVKPGITGWAQVNGYRGQTEQLWQMEKRVEYDTWYIEHWTFMLDMKIMVRTMFNAIRGEKNAF